MRVVQHGGEDACVEQCVRTYQPAHAKIDPHADEVDINLSIGAKLHAGG